MALIDKLTAIADAIRGKTGKTEEMTIDQMVTEIDGIQVGGGGSSFGENTVSPNILNIFHALENGYCVTGEFTLASYLQNGENLVIDTGLKEVHGLFYADTDYSYSTNDTSGEYSIYGLHMVGATRGEKNVVEICGLSTPNYGVNMNLITRATAYRIDDGKLYVTPQYGGNANYSPFCKGHRYKWLAW